MNEKLESNSSDPKQQPKEEAIQSFLRKTYEMLENDYYNSSVSWSQDGKSLVIHSPKEFAQHVLPIFFKHNNITSFTRQLNMYQFKKKKGKLSEHIYSHEMFERGRKDLLKFIQRKITKGQQHLTKSKSEKLEGEEDITTSICSENLGLSHENSLLKKVQLESNERIQFLERKICEVSQKREEIEQQIQKQRKTEFFLRMVINQVACFFGPNAIQNIFQIIKARTGEMLSIYPIEEQSFKPELMPAEHNFREQNNPKIPFQTSGDSFEDMTYNPVSNPSHLLQMNAQEEQKRLQRDNDQSLLNRYSDSFREPPITRLSENQYFYEENRSRKEDQGSSVRFSNSIQDSSDNFLNQAGFTSTTDVSTIFPLKNPTIQKKDQKKEAKKSI